MGIKSEERIIEETFSHTRSHNPRSYKGEKLRLIPGATDVASHQHRFVSSRFQF